MRARTSPRDAPAIAAVSASLRARHVFLWRRQCALCASREFVTSTIIGATQLTQLAEDLQGFSVEWTQEMEDEVMKVYEQYPDPWRVQVAGMG